MEEKDSKKEEKILESQAEPNTQNENTEKTSNKTKTKKSGFTKIFIFLLLVIIAGMGYFIYYLYNEKTNNNQEISELNSKISLLEKEIKENKKDNSNEKEESKEKKESNTEATNKDDKNNTDNKDKNTNTNTNTNTNETKKETETKTAEPYVKLQNLEILTTANTYSTPTYNYTTSKADQNTKKDYGVTFEKSSAKYKFYDYTVSEPDKNNNVQISFKTDIIAPIKYSWPQGTTFPEDYYYYSEEITPNLFDYYTGVYYSSNYYSDSDSKDNRTYKYTDINYNGKTIKIGLRIDSTTKWDGVKSESETCNSDTHRTRLTYYITAPKGYSGMLVSIYKKGMSEELYNKKIEAKTKHKELEKQATETGKKSAELLELEKPQKLLETHLKDFKYEKNDFYIFNINKITPSQKK